MGQPSTPVWSADGKQIFYEIYSGDTASICVVDEDGGNNRVLADVPECSFHLLNDGRFLLLGFQGEIDSFDPETGETSQMLPGMEYLPIAWDAGGKFAAAVLIGEGVESDRLMLFDLKGKTEIKRWEIPQYAPIYFDFDSFSPGGDKFAFLYTNDEGQNLCYMLDLKKVGGK
jgi:Tol biopolymer transport system component